MGELIKIIVLYCILGDLECHFKCISPNIIFYTICTLGEKVYKGATSRKLGDRFREHVKISLKTSRGAFSLYFAAFHDALM